MTRSKVYFNYVPIIILYLCARYIYVRERRKYNNIVYVERERYFRGDARHDIIHRDNWYNNILYIEI